MPMTVQVRLNAILRKYAGPDGQVDFATVLPVGAAVDDIIRKLGIPSEEVGLAAVNLKYAERNQILAEGDRVILFPQLTGGRLVST